MIILPKTFNGLVSSQFFQMTDNSTIILHRSILQTASAYFKYTTRLADVFGALHSELLDDSSFIARL
ncbi:hypothetical protein HY58_18450 [Flavihumibacter sp. ZG627]|nr:hypothetical protein HY58_18450 [Flavihumibacter sp. ZG627]